MIRNNPDFREQRKRYCVYDVYYLLASIECLKVNNWLKEKLLFFFCFLIANNFCQDPDKILK